MLTFLYICIYNDYFTYCKNCDDYQPSCNADSDCTNGQACCRAYCRPSCCKQCQGCYTCECLPDLCGYSDDFVKRIPCQKNCIREEGLECQGDTFSNGDYGSYCAPKYTCKV